MKKFSVWAIGTLALSLMLTVGVGTFMGPCIHEDGTFGSCHWAGQALMGLGILMSILSLGAIFWKKGRPGLLAATGGAAVLGLFVPGHLIRLCSMATMRCQSAMKPGVTVCCCLILALSVIGLLMTLKKER